MRRCWPPDLSIVAKVAALMHELGEILGETSDPNRSPYLSSAANTDARLLSFTSPFAAVRTS
ncbi:hypothetical protein CN200_34075 [Sinorhizobium meliloti]|nr:hypothetical protein CN205_34970 [Sinorhizobium meliloti]RVI02844.1 hypothetical protein CN200_34075 [Sinorhizobium meliloti]RVM38995.1 hypothetical protein CN127_33850 [Sinorhizobium meliloti]RVN56403.1 hypothetical protein CN106_33985 [Sinorhizobium meliloti]RVN78817.1 hypothetical protein CN107_32185 [Sinorhizobium meliloti]